MILAVSWRRLLDVGDGGRHLAHCLIALARSGLGFSRKRRCLLGGLGILLGHRGHLFERAGRFLQRGGLFACALGNGLARCRNLLRRRGNLLRTLPQRGGDPVQGAVDSANDEEREQAAGERRNAKANDDPALARGNIRRDGRADLISRALVEIGKVACRLGVGLICRQSFGPDGRDGFGFLALVLQLRDLLAHIVEHRASGPDLIECRSILFRGDRRFVILHRLIHGVRMLLHLGEHRRPRFRRVDRDVFVEHLVILDDQCLEPSAGVFAGKAIDHDTVRSGIQRLYPHVGEYPKRRGDDNAHCESEQNAISNGEFHGFSRLHGVTNPQPRCDIAPGA